MSLNTKIVVWEDNTIAVPSVQDVNIRKMHKRQQLIQLLESNCKILSIPRRKDCKVMILDLFIKNK